MCHLCSQNPRAWYKTFFRCNIQLAYLVRGGGGRENKKLNQTQALSKKLFINISITVFAWLWSAFWKEDICSPLSIPLMHWHARTAAGENKERKKLQLIAKGSLAVFPSSAITAECAQTALLSTYTVYCICSRANGISLHFVKRFWK